MHIEREFAEIDFSLLSEVKENLRTRLLRERSKRSQKVELFEDELDFLAAAGSNPKNFSSPCDSSEK